MPQTPFRFPDKPAHSLRYGQPIPPGNYLCQYKPDGERCIVTFKAGQPLHIVSRHNRPLADQAAALRHVQTMLDSRNFDAKGFVFDAEHVCQRRGSKSSKRSETVSGLYLLDCLELNGQELYAEACDQRWLTLKSLGFAYPFTVPSAGFVSEHATASFIERAKAYAESRPGMAIEGVVLKRSDSTYIGSTVSSALNSAWTKIKW